MLLLEWEEDYIAEAICAAAAVFGFVLSRSFREQIMTRLCELVTIDTEIENARCQLGGIPIT